MCIYQQHTHTHSRPIHSWPPDLTAPGFLCIHPPTFLIHHQIYSTHGWHIDSMLPVVLFLWCFALFLVVMFIVSYVSDYYFCLSHITDCVLSVSLHALLLPCPKCKLYTTTTTDYGCKPFDELICVLFQMQGFSLWSVCTVTSLFPQSALNFWLNLWPQVRFRGCSLPYRS